MKTNFTQLVKYVSVLCFIFISFVGFAQSNSITGTVKGSDGQGIPGVSILVKGTTTGVASDVDGNFSLEAAVGSNLIFSSVGYETKTVLVTSQGNYAITLTASSQQLEDVVVVGYGTQNKATVTGAVSAIKGADLVKSPTATLSTSLAGRLPGLTVIQTNGEPGQDAARINIRGINTLGNSSPLVVIDGVPDRDGGLARLNPVDIASVSVLKDASSAIYGSRAANGVILITTKRGESGKPTVKYSFNQGLTQPSVIPKMANGYEYASIMNELPIYKSIPQAEWGNAWNSIQTTGSYDSPTAGVSTLNANYSPAVVNGNRDGSDPWLYPNSDWFGETFRTWAPQSQHNVSMQGGNDNVKYFTSMGYLHQDAIYKNSATYYNQYNFRLNLDAKINDYIKSSMGVLARREDRNYPTVGSGAIFRMLMRGRPVEPAVWPTGQPGPDIENGEQPLVVTTGATGYDKQPTDFAQFNGSFVITNPWIKGLELTLSGALDINKGTRKLWQTPWDLYFWNGTDKSAAGLTAARRSPFSDPRLTQSYSSVLNSNLTALLKYEKNFGKHDLNFLIGATKEKFSGDYFLAYRRNYISTAIDQLFAGGREDMNTNGSAYNRARLGYYGRVQYDYDQKYLAEFIFRRDGSYIFPEAGRFGFFPGLLLGYNVSREPWFNTEKINNLKIRASYGELGNDQVFYNNSLQEYAFLSSYSFGQYPINNQVVNTLYETGLANPNFTWEVAKNYNLGVDLTILNRLNITLEVFNNNRENILIQKQGSTPASSGIANLLPPVNLGEFNNRGFEFSFDFAGKTNEPDKFNYSIGLNGGYAKNKVVFFDEAPGLQPYQTQTGKPWGSYLVYLTDGVFYDQAEIEANKVDYSGVTPKLIPGDLKIKDYNGDGKIDADDRVRLDKNTTPTFQYGIKGNFNYKNFDLSILFQGAMGGLVRFYTESGDIGNFLKYSYDNRWSIENPSHDHPRLASRGDTYYTGGNFGNNDYFLFNTNYIRLKNIEFGYNVPKKLLEKSFISNLRFYVNGFNVLTLASQKIFDPETTNGAGTFYPQQRIINFGFNLTF
ncbi:MAG: hypothetical protein RIR51_800 [Bacteroidota bacterium]